MKMTCGVAAPSGGGEEYVMIRAPRTLRVLLVASLVSAVLVGTACTPSPAEDAPGVLGVEETVVDHAALPAEERVIGLTELGEGRVRAVGIIQYRADEGASWCIVEGSPGVAAPPDAPVIVVIENMADLDAACSTPGRLVYAEGVLADDDGTLPGPPLTAEFVARAD